MQINKSQKRLLVVLAVVVCYAVYDLAFPGNKPEKEDFQISTRPQMKGTAEASDSVQIEKNSYTFWGKDPFQGKKSKVQIEKTALSLSAISYTNENAIAFLNNRIVKIGDKVEGWYISEIKQDRVVLSRGNKLRTLYLAD
jgi:hypothetical protein